MHSKLRTKNRGDGKDVRVKFIAGVSRERGGGLVFRGGGGGGVRPAGGGGVKVRPVFFPREQIYTDIHFPGRFYPGPVYPGGSSMLGDSMLQHT